VARRFAALLAVVLGLGAWTALGMAGSDTGPRPENNTWGLVKSSIGEHGPFRDRTRPKATQSSPSRSCAPADSDGGSCSDLTGMPEPMTLLLFGAMLAGLGVVVRWGLRGRRGTSG
jgi:hypothetical protein